MAVVTASLTLWQRAVFGQYMHIIRRGSAPQKILTGANPGPFRGSGIPVFATRPHRLRAKAVATALLGEGIRRRAQHQTYWQAFRRRICASQPPCMGRALRCIVAYVKAGCVADAAWRDNSCRSTAVATFGPAKILRPQQGGKSGRVACRSGTV